MGKSAGKVGAQVVKGGIKQGKIKKFLISEKKRGTRRGNERGWWPRLNKGGNLKIKSCK